MLLINNPDSFQIGRRGNSRNVVWDAQPAHPLPTSPLKGEGLPTLYLSYFLRQRIETGRTIADTPLRSIPVQSEKRARPLSTRTAPLLDLGSAHEDARSLATLARLVGLNPYFIRDSIGVRMRHSKHASFPFRLSPMPCRVGHRSGGAAKRSDASGRLPGAVLLKRSSVLMGAALTKKTGAVHARNGNGNTYAPVWYAGTPGAPPLCPRCRPRRICVPLRSTVRDSTVQGRSPNWRT